ncbi:MAG: helix-turn-helix domain-containing protein [Thermoleophilia bacterium]
MTRSTAASDDKDFGPVRAEEQETTDVIDLAQYLAQPRSQRSAFLVSDERDRKRIPPSVHRILLKVVQEMAAGNAVSIVPVHHELTTQEAADLLNVSRPHVVKLLEEGAIPYHMVGTHRRLRFDDLISYRKRRSARRREILTALAEENEKLGL